jgi:hypothetical protein
MHLFIQLDTGAQRERESLHYDQWTPNLELFAVRYCNDDVSQLTISLG